ncbi:hypothetical protein [Empedobacter brevis]|uniref:hypothetical protein n=1 Tax=Empedobacter brevis TaxID=247 RepID=UPI0028D3CDA2|nr:hypothetical protein [Empedobacter brevis]
MELTGKAEEEYFKKVNYNEVTFDLLSESIIINALIVEWFETLNAITIDKDTVNTRMIVTDWNGQEEVQHFIDCTYEELTKSGFTNWWKQAIIKANEIYNERFK